MKKKTLYLFNILALLALLLSACAAPAASPQPAKPTQAAAPKPAEPTQAAAPKPAEPTQAAAPKPAEPTQTAAPKPAEPTQADAPTSAPAAEAAAALKVTGKVTSEMSWTEEQVKAMPAVQVEAKNKKGDLETYTGVLIADLLKLAGPLPEAAKVIFVAGDGYTAETALSDLMACTNCIVSFRSQGGFSILMPDASSDMQVKDVVELKVE